MIQFQRIRACLKIHSHHLPESNFQTLSKKTKFDEVEPWMYS